MRAALLSSLAVLACSPVDLGPAGDLESEGEQISIFCRPGPRKFDVLFVVDDSSSMADEAARVASSARGFGDVLTAPDMGLDVRVAVTRTDTVDCGSERGVLLDTSCLQRADDFVSTMPSDGAPAIDVWAEGCAAECSLDTLWVNNEPPAGTPWLAEILGQPGGLSRAPLADALACLLPVGVGGCEQESPLAAMLAAIERSLDADDPAYGWMRDDAGLLAVLITDEDEVDPELPLLAATRLRQLLAFKQTIDPELSVMLGLVAGWDDTEEADPSGCTSHAQSAAPPLRLDVLRHATEEVIVETASICGHDFTTVLHPLGSSLRQQLRPGCIDHCVEIGEDAAPHCTAQLREWTGLDDVAQPLAHCLPDPVELWRVPEGEDLCIAFLADEYISEICSNRGSNVEVQLLVREGAPILGASCIEVTCQVADDPDTACSGMP